MLHSPISLKIYICKVDKENMLAKNNKILHAEILIIRIQELNNFAIKFCLTFWFIFVSPYDILSNVMIYCYIGEVIIRFLVFDFFVNVNKFFLWWIPL